MAKSKLLIAAELRIAALEAQVVLARVCYRELKASIVMPAHVPTPGRSSMPVVSRYRDGLGREWIKTRIGNTATSKLAIESIAS